MARKNVSEIIIKDARIFFKNFSGEESKFNRKGDKNFCVAIEDAEVAAQMIEDGWNVKLQKPLDEDDEPSYYVQVKVSFDPYPPKVYMITGQNKVELNEETIASLDYADIGKVNLIIRPYTWEVSGKSGISAYLKTMYVEINEDPFAAEYSHLDDEDLPEMY